MQSQRIPSTSRTRGKATQRIVLGAWLAVELGAAVALAGTPALAKEEAVSPTQARCTGNGQVWWTELITPDPQKTGDFYAKVAGWKLSTVDSQGQIIPPASPAHEYTTFEIGGDEVAGMMKSDNPAAIHSASGWLVYIQVRDVDIAAETVRTSGGKVLREPYSNADGNRMALIRDPAGSLVALVTPGKNEPC